MILAPGDKHPRPAEILLHDPANPRSAHILRRHWRFGIWEAATGSNSNGTTTLADWVVSIIPVA
jgi:hypothetical protein